MDWTIQTPARLELLGPSQGGKSTLLLKLVGDSSVWDRLPQRVMYCAPTLADRDDYLARLREVCESNGQELQCVEKIPLHEEMLAFAEGKPLMFIADDLLALEEGGSRMRSLMLMDSHHCNISVLYTVQNPFYKSPHLDLVTLSRNLSGRLVLYQQADLLQYKLISSRLFPERKNFLLDCLSEAKTLYNLNYVYADLHCFSRLPRRYMCFTAMFADERIYGSPLFFDLKHR